MYENFTKVVQRKSVSERQRITYDYHYKEIYYVSNQYNERKKGTLQFS